MNQVLELFGYSTGSTSHDWNKTITDQHCPYIGSGCYKVRKSAPESAIGTCSVSYGKNSDHILICPSRLLERKQVFSDSMHLLTAHEPGNELHLISEVSVPGGSVDYFLVSVRDGKVKDFVGIEFQTLDTTGTVWPERQRTLRKLGVEPDDDAEHSTKRFGMNWKMTAKTILVQLHHKIQTFENVNRKLVLVIQDKFLAYMEGEFDFKIMKEPPSTGDSMHFHAYALQPAGGSYKLGLHRRLSTDVSGIASCLGLQANANVELEEIFAALESKLSGYTIFTPV